MTIEAPSTGDRDCEEPFRQANLPIWRELTWGLEWLDLLRSPVYRGRGVPDGQGAAVVLVPGFLGTDSYLFELRRWLRRAGYRVTPSGIGRNMDCPDVMLAELIEAVEEAAARAGEPVQLIGHSLGGTLARAAAVQRPDLVAHVITLGSPLRNVVAHPLVIGIARLLQRRLPPPDEQPRLHGDHLHGGSCSCETLDALGRRFPREVRRTAIFTRSDGVVDPASAVDPDPRLNLEVRGTHVGLIVNRAVYEALAGLLRPAVPRGPARRAA